MLVSTFAPQKFERIINFRRPKMLLSYEVIATQSEVVSRYLDYKDNKHYCIRVVYHRLCEINEHKSS